MSITRRAFGKSTGMGLFLLAIGSTLATTGCNVFSDILAWIPVAKSAVSGIVTLLEENGLVVPAMNSIFTAILTGLDDLAADVQIYQTVSPPPASELAKIQAIFGLIVSNFETLLAQFNVSSPALTVVIGLAQVILSTIAGFLGDLPMASGVKTVILSGTFHAGGQLVAYTPKRRTIRQFKRDYNRIASASGQSNIGIPLTLWERI